MTKKKVYYYGKKDLEGLKWTARVIEFGVSLEVAAAFNEMDVTTILLRDNDRLNQQLIKKFCNKANDKQRQKWAEIKRFMVNKKFFDDYSDNIIDAAKKDILLFRLAIKQKLDDARCPHAEMISHAESARCLLDMAVYQWDVCIEESRKRFGRDYGPSFSEYRVGDVLHWWTKFCNLLYGDSDVSVDLNSERASKAFDIICKKFADGKYVSECLDVAMAEQPDFCNQIVMSEE